MILDKHTIGREYYAVDGLTARPGMSLLYCDDFKGTAIYQHNGRLYKTRGDLAIVDTRDNPKTGKTTESLEMKHKGVPAVVFASGKNIHRDMRAVPDNAIRIAVNTHYACSYNADYVVLQDYPRSSVVDKLFKGQLKYILKNTNIKIISRWAFVADYIVRVPKIKLRNSSILAFYEAIEMGCNPIYLCGMDCYEGLAGYQELSDNVAMSWKGALSIAKDVVEIKPMGNILKKVLEEIQ